MGQKVGGYRRNVPYGRETNLLQGNQEKRGSGWIFDVNPKGRVGWNRGTSGRKEKEYGESLSEGRRLRKALEEVRRTSGCESNGLGRKGTKESGYVVYGEYTRGNSENGGEERGEEKAELEKKREESSIKVRGKEDLMGSRERVLIRYEKKREAKVERKRTNLKERREEKGLRRSKKNRMKVLPHSSKRRKGEERCEAIALSGRIPTGKRRTNLIVRELENGLNHIEVLRNVEALRKHHAKSSRSGRKRLGESERESSKASNGGYYGLKVSVKGPLEGARRTILYEIQLGTVPRGTKRARRMITHEHAKTKVGAVGVRVTYCYGRG